jgi:hypothetical protein
MQHLGADLLGQQRQAGLLPGQPGRAVRGGGRRRDDAGGGQFTRVALGIGALAHDRDVGARSGQCAQQPVDVPADAAPVGRDTRGVD